MGLNSTCLTPAWGTDQSLKARKTKDVVLKGNKDQIKGTVKIPSWLRSTCLSPFFPIGNFPYGNTAAGVVFRHGTALGSTAGSRTGWVNMDGLSQIFTAKAQICATTRVGLRDWGNRSSWNFFPGLPIPPPASNSAQGRTAVEAAGPAWLGTVLGTWGSSWGQRCGTGQQGPGWH